MLNTKAKTITFTIPAISLPSLPTMPKLRKLTQEELIALFTAAVMLLAMAATKTYVFSLATGAMLLGPTAVLYASVGAITYMMTKTFISPIPSN